MNWDFSKILKAFSDKKYQKLLSKGQYGLERECLRVGPQFHIAQTPHPAKFGSPLTHKYISTDYSESQLELITPPFNTPQESLKFLKDIHLEIVAGLSKESLWPSSMPCILPKDNKIPLAQYGQSVQGKSKTIYRRGLGLRYGRKMQTISGIHYNFSFSSKLWDHLIKTFKIKGSKQEFMSQAYFAVMRNFLRYGWLHTYLFGASPAIHRSFLNKRTKLLNKCIGSTCYGEHATSLRISDFGYNSKVQKQLAVSYNKLEDYISDLKYAITKPKPAYAKLGLIKNGIPQQLNANLLQIENEYYSVVRPKQVLQGQNETMTSALAKRGVEYIEIRTVDLNPLQPIGTEINELKFLHLLTIYCLFKKSPNINKQQKLTLIENFNRTGLYGRKPGLTLQNGSKEITLKDWAHQILTDLQKIADLLDPSFTAVIEKQLAKVHDPQLTPSAQVLTEMLKHGGGIISYMGHLSQQHLTTLKKSRLLKQQKAHFQKIKKSSLKKQEDLEILSDFLLDGHEDMELSTQILIRDAQKRKIKVDILDRQENFLRLSKGRKQQYVKQATKTSLDSYITFLMMENKQVTKTILNENSISVPAGNQFSDIQEAQKYYTEIKKSSPRGELVIKPTNTNYGIGLHFIKVANRPAYKKAVQSAFQHDDSIIIEQFIPGKEYRFLVFGNKVVGVLNRRPASVLGDGRSTIKELVYAKNADPRSYKVQKDHIQLGNTELQFLKKQKLTFQSIPKKGKRIFLRQNSNIGTGGDPLDVTDQMPNAFKRIAIKAAQSVNAKICGVDMIIPNLKKPAKKDNYAIIELNFNPPIWFHNFPFKGQNRDVGNKLLDLLGF